MNQNKKTILIAGANGFIGSNLRNFLKGKNFNVISLVRYKSSIKKNSNDEIVYYKNNNIILNNKIKINYIIHCAGNAHDKNYSISNLDNEKKFTLQLLNLCKNSDVEKFIFISSIKVNGENTYKEKFSENNKIKPYGLYAINKMKIENMIQKFFDKNTCNYYILRLPIVIGNSAKGNLYKMFKFINKYKFFINVKTINTRSFLSINNLNSLVLKIIYNNKKIQDIFLVCNNETFCVNDILINLKKLNISFFVINFNYYLLLLIFTILNKKDIFNKLFLSQDINNSKVKNTFSWNPENDLNNNLEKMFRSFKINE